MDFPDRAFECVNCTEVLEHIPPNLLATACKELSRVAYKVRQLACRSDRICASAELCAPNVARNPPPWGHVNSFDERKLIGLFPGWRVDEWSMLEKRDNAPTSCPRS